MMTINHFCKLYLTVQFQRFYLNIINNCRLLGKTSIYCIYVRIYTVIMHVP